TEPRLVRAGPCSPLCCAPRPPRGPSRQREHRDRPTRRGGAVANESKGPGPARSKGMSVREAGRMGGEARKSQLGPQGYSELGQKGGQRVRQLIEEGKARQAQK